MTIENVKIGNKLSIGEGGPSLSGSTEKIDPRITMSGSIFAGAFSSKAPTNETAAEKSEENPSHKSLLKKIMTMPKEAKEATSSCKNSSKTSQENVQTNKNMMQAIKSQGQKNLFAIAANDKQTATLDKENGKLDTEINDLTAERDALSTDDGTGSGENSAYSLNMFQDAAPANDKTGTDKTKTSEDNPNQEKADALNSQIDSKTSSLTFNSTKMASFNKTGNSLKQNLNALYNQAISQAGKTSTAATQGQKTVDTTKTISTSVTGLGGAAIALGSTTFFSPVTAAALVSYGGIGVAAGTVGNMTASLSAGDINGANQSSQQLISAAGTLKKSPGASEKPVEKPADKKPA